MVDCGEDGDGAAGGGSAALGSNQRTIISLGGQPAEADDEEEEAIKPLPDRLVMELSAERTLALRDKLAGDPATAFLAVLHKFCRDVFSRYCAHGVAMDVAVRGTAFPAQSPELRGTTYARAIEARQKRWEARLPSDVAELWDALAALDGPEQAELFAHCASFGVNALYERADRYGGGAIPALGVQSRLAEADHLARATGLDMTEAGWRPTVSNYLGRVTKARILKAVREGAGERAAQLIDHMKKGDMAKEAERLLADTGWLPEPLRLADAEPAPDVATTEGEIEALPGFLAGDDDESPNSADGEDGPGSMVAAESAQHRSV